VNIITDEELKEIEGDIIGSNSILSSLVDVDVEILLEQVRLLKSRLLNEAEKIILEYYHRHGDLEAKSYIDKYIKKEIE
jgi:hypothetical protein